jgi:hypothetical protein
LDLKKEPKQREVTMSREDKNQNGKRMTETKLTGKKARKLSKKRAKIRKLQKTPEETSQKEKSQELSFVRDIRTTTSGTSPWHNNIVVGPIYPFDFHPEWVEKKLWVPTRPLDNTRMDRTSVNAGPISIASRPLLSFPT